ncbi:MAG: site-specific DNA-methyltransferase [Acidimicrobiia bacterium]
MRSAYYEGDRVTLHHGDSLEVLREMPNQSVDCCVTSPPYFGLRDYGVEGQYGLEASPAEYVETMRALFAEVRRVLTDDGTLWLNIGDSYSGSWGNQGRKEERGTQRAINGPMMTPVHDGRYPTTGSNTGAIKPGAPPAKNLLGIPWRTAFALQDDGWILRNDIIWSKPNAMPESVTDRLSTRHEHLFMLSKSARYWFDLDPIREPHTETSIQRAQPHRTAPGRSAREGLPYAGVAQAQTLNLDQMNHPNGRNPGDVWDVSTRPFSEAHFAVMPPLLAERAILAGCKPSGVVLDPFSGSGTTGMAALKHGRRYVGVDLSADYLDLSLRTRFAQPGFDFGGDVA